MKPLSFELLSRREQERLADGGATNAAELQKLQEMLVEVMQRELTERQRLVLDYHFYQNLSYTEIARRLGVNKSTVCRIKNCALNTLARFLQYYKTRPLP